MRKIVRGGGRGGCAYGGGAVTGCGGCGGGGGGASGGASSAAGGWRWRRGAGRAVFEPGFFWNVPGASWCTRTSHIKIPCGCRVRMLWCGWQCLPRSQQWRQVRKQTPPRAHADRWNTVSSTQAVALYRRTTVRCSLAATYWSFLTRCLAGQLAPLATAATCTVAMRAKLHRGATQIRSSRTT